MSKTESDEGNVFNTEARSQRRRTEAVEARRPAVREIDACAQGAQRNELPPVDELRKRVAQAFAQPARNGHQIRSDRLRQSSRQHREVEQEHGLVAPIRLPRAELRLVDRVLASAGSGPPASASFDLRHHGVVVARLLVTPRQGESTLADSDRVVLQTVAGSVEFARASGKHMAELRNMVTSPGGTSAEAIYQMEKGGLRTVFSRAVYAAYQRTQSLARNSVEKL